MDVSLLGHRLPDLPRQRCLLCSFHHHELHRKRWRIVRNGSQLTFYDRNPLPRILRPARPTPGPHADVAVLPPDTPTRTAHQTSGLIRVAATAAGEHLTAYAPSTNCSTTSSPPPRPEPADRWNQDQFTSDSSSFDVPASRQSAQRYDTMSPGRNPTGPTPSSNGAVSRWQVPPQSTHTIVVGTVTDARRVPGPVGVVGIVLEVGVIGRVGHPQHPSLLVGPALGP